MFLRGDSSWMRAEMARSKKAWPTSVPPAIRPDHLPIDPAALCARQKRHDARNILRLPEPAERDLVGQALDQLRGAAGEQQLGCDRPGRHGVDGDAAGAELL